MSPLSWNRVTAVGSYPLPADRVLWKQSNEEEQKKDGAQETLVLASLSNPRGVLLLRDSLGLQDRLPEKPLPRPPQPAKQADSGAEGPQRVPLERVGMGLFCL